MCRLHQVIDHLVLLPNVFLKVGRLFPGLAQLLRQVHKFLGELLNLIEILLLLVVLLPNLVLEANIML